MATLSVATKANQAVTLPAVLGVAYANELDPNARINLNFVDSDKLPAAGSPYAELKSTTGETTHGAEKIIAELAGSSKLQLAVSQSAMHEWLTRLPSFAASDYKSLEPYLLELDAHLILRSYVVGYALNLADVAIWGAIRGSRVGAAAVKKGNMVNLTRWFKFVEEASPWITATVQQMNASAHEKRAAASSKGGSYDIELKDTEKGVVTRFPPEPS